MILTMPPKKATTSSGATGSGGNDGNGGNTGSVGSGGGNTTPEATRVPETTTGTTTGAAGMTAEAPGTTGTAPASATPAAHTPVIAKIIELCDFPEDSTMVKFIEQQNWTMLVHATSILLDEIKDFHTKRRDGSYEATPMQIHLRMFKCFLLYYKRKGRELSSNLHEDDVMDMRKTDFHEYCGSDNYVLDAANGGVPLHHPSPGPKVDPSLTGMVNAFDGFRVSSWCKT